MNIHKKLEMWKNGFLAVLFGASCDTECFNRYVGELKRHSSTVALVPWTWIDQLLLPNRDRISNRTSVFFGVDSKTRKRWKRPSQKCVSPSQVPRKNRLQVDVLRWKVEYSALWSLRNFLKLCPTLGTLIYSKMVISLTYTQVIPWILHLTYRSSIALGRCTSTGIFRETSWPSWDSNAKPSDLPCQILTGAYQQDWPE